RCARITTCWLVVPSANKQTRRNRRTGRTKFSMIRVFVRSRMQHASISKRCSLYGLKLLGQMLPVLEGYSFSESAKGKPKRQNHVGRDSNIKQVNNLPGMVNLAGKQTPKKSDSNDKQKKRAHG